MRETPGPKLQFEIPHFHFILSFVFESDAITSDFLTQLYNNISLSPMKNAQKHASSGRSSVSKPGNKEIMQHKIVFWKCQNFKFHNGRASV